MKVKRYKVTYEDNKTHQIQLPILVWASDTTLKKMLVKPVKSITFTSYSKL